jgi:hypothetical protein
MSFVRNLLRALVAVVAVACAAQPMALDACHAACDRVKAARAAAPPCHHVAAAGPQIGQNARPCSQDHAVMPGDPGPRVAPKTQTILSTAPGVVALFAHDLMRVGPVDSSPGPAPILISLSSNTPLRV